MNARTVGILFIVAAIVVAVAFAIDLMVSSGHRIDENWSVFSADPREPGEAYEPLPDVRPDRPRLADLMARELETRELLNPVEFDASRRLLDHEYTIKTGDVLDDLAAKFLGRPELKTRIFEANPELRSGAPLAPGTKIVIPFRFQEK